jgi:hypothetical protein
VLSWLLLTGLWAERSGFRIQAGARHFSVFENVQTSTVAHPALLFDGYQPEFSVGVQWPVRGVDHPPSSMAEIKETVELYLYCCGPAGPVLGRTVHFVQLLLFCAGSESGLLLPELCTFGVSFESRDFYSECAWFVSCSGHRLLKLSYSLLSSPLLRDYSVILPQITPRPLSNLYAY